MNIWIWAINIWITLRCHCIRINKREHKVSKIQKKSTKKRRKHFRHNKLPEVAAIDYDIQIKLIPHVLKICKKIRVRAIWVRCLFEEREKTKINKLIPTILTDKETTKNSEGKRKKAFIHTIGLLFYSCSTVEPHTAHTHTQTLLWWWSIWINYFQCDRRYYIYTCNTQTHRVIYTQHTHTHIPTRFSVWLQKSFHYFHPL